MACNPTNHAMGSPLVCHQKRFGHSTEFVDWHATQKDDVVIEHVSAYRLDAEIHVPIDLRDLRNRLYGFIHKRVVIVR
jgi:hypothetical protein